MKLIINNKCIFSTNKFAYDGCHKIYIIEDENDLKEAKKHDYEIHDIKELPKIWENSCDLRFIHNWKLTKTYISQFTDGTIIIK